MTQNLPARAIDLTDQDLVQGRGQAQDQGHIQEGLDLENQDLTGQDLTGPDRIDQDQENTLVSKDVNRDANKTDIKDVNAETKDDMNQDNTEIPLVALARPIVHTLITMFITISSPKPTNLLPNRRASTIMTSQPPTFTLSQLVCRLSQ